jgi:hypothetical protein
MKKIKFLVTIMFAVIILINPIKVNAASGWQSDDTGWWYEVDGWYPASQWYQVNGIWYYFNESGYMEASCYRDGYWLNADGSWNETYKDGYWDSNATGWWYTDSSGWYPISRWLQINGKWYYFESDGYMAADEWVGNAYVDGNGAWVPNKKKETSTSQNNEQKTVAQTSEDKQENTSNTNNNKTNDTSNIKQETTSTTSNTSNERSIPKKWDDDATYTIHFPEFTSGYRAKVVQTGNTNSRYIETTNYVKCMFCGTEYADPDEYFANDTCAKWTYSGSELNNITKDSNGNDCLYGDYLVSSGQSYSIYTAEWLADSHYFITWGELRQAGYINYTFTANPAKTITTEVYPIGPTLVED